MISVLIGFALSAVIAVLAYAKKSLSESGVIMAIILGTTVYAGAGLFAFSALILFFLSTSLISKFSADKKPSNRNGFQVLANGSLAALFAFFYYVEGDTIYYVLIFLSIAISATDTWSSEIGRLSKRNPRNIFTYQIMSTGLSGGVTLLGVFASVFAAFIFSFFACLVLNDFTLILTMTAFAFLGSIIDSMLGTIQVKYKLGDVLSEKKEPGFVRHSGLPWLNNSMVNFLANGITLILFILTYNHFL